jgi:hypothetical protein
MYDAEGRRSSRGISLARSPLYLKKEASVIVQVHTNPDLEDGGQLTPEVEALVESVVGRFADRVSRVQVHLGDENSSVKRGSNDKRCMMEARIDGAAPVAVTELAPTIEQALNGAADKLERSLDSRLGRERDRGGATDRSVGEP